MKKLILVGLVLLMGGGCKQSGSSAKEAEVLLEKKLLSGQTTEYYTCPMHPEVHSDHPGDCPICHMRLVKKTTEVGAPSGVPKKGERKIKFYRNPMDPSIHLDHPAKDDMGMDYIPVYEDQVLNSAQSVSGRSDVGLTGDQQGVSGIQSVAVEEREMTKSVSMPGRMTGGGQASFQVFEEDLGLIQVGTKLVATSPSLPGVELTGSITAIDSFLDPMSRTGRVVGSIKNPDSKKLRGESSLVGIARIALGKSVALPEAAVLHTGLRDLVYVEVAPGRFSPREVRLGSKSEGYYQVLQGLEVSTRVAAGPNFLLDSESRIRASYDQTNH